MAYKWVYEEPERQETVSMLQEQLGVPETIARLLAIREIDTYEKARAFFRPDLDALHDPFLMEDMDPAATRLAEAIREGETILVYGDYDVDGTTATALLYTFLQDFGVEVDYYIPDRHKEGYGINPEGIEYALREEVDLIVSVDCGITAIDEAQYARDRGLDLIICDHHTVGEEIPGAVAVLDPKRTDDSYPFDGLSGAGVGFKLVQGTLQKLGLDPEVAYEYLDLVAISIASDIVPIVDENRIMMRKGLELLNENPRLGIRALLDLINMEVGTLTSSNIVFSIGPRINAAGRMGDAARAVELMIADKEAEARTRAHELESINHKRRDTDSETMEQAVEMVSNYYDMEKTASMVLHHPDWHLGVIGIVASRLVDQYYRPAIMLSTVDGKIKGSARSIEGFNIYEALKQCEDLLEQFGGHQYAAGLTMAKENLEEFRRRMNEIAFEDLTQTDFEPELNIDDELDLSQMDLKFWKLLSQFEPFGPGNHRPVFVSRGVDVNGIPTIVGKGHLKMSISHNGSGDFDAIGFNMHEYMPTIRNSPQGGIDIAYSLEENYWNGKCTLQVRLKDIKVNEEEAVGV